MWLDGKAVWGRMDTCIRMIEFLCCSPERITALLIGYTSKQNKKVEKIKKKKGVKTMNTPYNINTHTHTQAQPRLRKRLDPLMRNG